MTASDDGSVAMSPADVPLGVGRGLYAFVAAFAGIPAVADGHAWLFPTQFEYLDVVEGLWPLYLVDYAPAAVAAAVLGIVIFGRLRTPVGPRPKLVAVTYGTSMAFAFALVGVVVGLLAHSGTLVVVTSAVAILVGALGSAIPFPLRRRLPSDT